MILATLFCLAVCTSHLDSSLEQNLSQTAIVDTRPIKIPGYPHAYNPSLVPYKEGYLLSFRFTGRFPETAKNSSRTDFSFIGVAKLDKKLNVIEKSIQLLNITSYASHFSLTAEDARLLNVGGRIFIFFNDLPLLHAHDGSAMYCGELTEERDGLFVFREPAKPMNYPRSIRIEKNWSPFFSQGKFYLIYSDQPRTILELDWNSGYCQEISRDHSPIPWNWGRIRGGTPACLVGDQFLTFFHSCHPAGAVKGNTETRKGLNYVMGAYLFDRDPPFSIQALHPKPLGRGIDYTEENPIKVIFPGGIVVQDHLILVAWGKADKEIFITTFDRKKLLSQFLIK